jgi:hypothetical protein
VVANSLLSFFFKFSSGHVVFSSNPEMHGLILTTEPT